MLIWNPLLFYMLRLVHLIILLIKLCYLCKHNALHFHLILYLSNNYLGNKWIKLYDWGSSRSKSWRHYIYISMKFRNFIFYTWLKSCLIICISLSLFMESNIFFIFIYNTLFIPFLKAPYYLWIFARMQLLDLFVFCLLLSFYEIDTEFL